MHWTFNYSSLQHALDATLRILVELAHRLRRHIISLRWVVINWFAFKLSGNWRCSSQCKRKNFLTTSNNDSVRSFNLLGREWCQEECSLGSLGIPEPCNPGTLENLGTLESCNPATLEHCILGNLQPFNLGILKPCRLDPCKCGTLRIWNLASPMTLQPGTRKLLTFLYYEPCNLETLPVRLQPWNPGTL